METWNLTRSNSFWMEASSQCEVSPSLKLSGSSVKSRLEVLSRNSAWREEGSGVAVGLLLECPSAMSAAASSMG